MPRKFLKKLLGSSPMTFSLEKIEKIVNLKSGGQIGLMQDESDMCISDEAFFESIEAQVQPKNPRRMNQKELYSLYDPKKKLTREQRLIKSVLNDTAANNPDGMIAKEILDKAKDFFEFRRSFHRYLFIKRFIPLCIIAPFTGNELSKMAYAAILGSKSISLTLPDLIGYSLPSFFFFHMTYYYCPDKIKPFCTLCKYTLGALVWVASAFTDKFTCKMEENAFGQLVPIDIGRTGGTIPSDIADFDEVRRLFENMRHEFGQKSC